MIIMSFPIHSMVIFYHCHLEGPKTWCRELIGCPPGISTAKKPEKRGDFPLENQRKTIKKPDFMVTYGFLIGKHKRTIQQTWVSIPNAPCM